MLCSMGRTAIFCVFTGFISGCVDPVGLVFDTDKVLAYHLGTQQAQPAAYETPSVPSAQTPSAAQYADAIAYETPDLYRKETCEYLDVALMSAKELMAKGEKEGNALVQQLAQARLNARTIVFREKSCPPSNMLGGRIGISLDDIDPAKAAQLKIPYSGVWVVAPIAGGTAEKAGVKASDVIVAFNDIPIRNSIDLRVLVGHAPIGSMVKLKIWRNQGLIELHTEISPSSSQIASANSSSSSYSVSTAKNPAGASNQINALGMKLDALTPSIATAVGLSPAHGALVVDITKGSKAAKAGLKPLDVITEIAGRPIQSSDDFEPVIAQLRPGYKMPITVWRNRKPLELTLEVPAATSANTSGSASTITQRGDTATEEIGNYCFATAMDLGEKKGFKSSVWKNIQGGVQGTTAAMLNFHSEVEKALPGVWSQLNGQAIDCKPTGTMGNFDFCSRARAEMVYLTFVHQQEFSYCFAKKSDAESSQSKIDTAFPTIPLKVIQMGASG